MRRARLVLALVVGAALAAVLAPDRHGARAQDAPEAPAALSAEDQARIDEQNRRTQALVKRGALAEAETSAREGVALCDRLAGPDRAEALPSLNLLVSVLRSRGLLAQALPLAERATAVAEKHLGPDHPQTAAGVSAQGELLVALGRASEARPRLERAVDAWAAKGERGEVPLARALAGLGAAALAERRWDEAAERWERALAIFERRLGPAAAEAADAVRGLATLAERQRRPEAARAYHARAFGLEEAAHGGLHPDAGAAASRLAALALGLGRYVEAYGAADRAVAVSEGQHGRADPRLVSDLERVASALVEMGRPDEAKPPLDRARAIAERSSGASSAEAARLRMAAAAAASLAGGDAEADAASRAALAALEAALGPGHPGLADPLREASGVRALAKQEGEARALAEREAALREAVWGEEDPSLAEAWSWLGDLRGKAGDAAGARKAFARATDLLAKRARRVVAGAAAPDLVRLHRDARMHLERLVPWLRAQGQTGWEEVARLKSLAARTADAERRLCREADPAAVGAARAAQEQVAAVARAWPRERDDRALARWKASLAQAAADRDRAFQSLARDHPATRAALERLEAGPREVGAALAPGEVLVDYLRTRDAYRAWVVAKGSAVCVDLPDPRTVERAVRAVLRTAGGQGAGTGRVGAVEERPRTEAEFFEVAAAEARKAVWEPVEARLPAAAKAVVLCPDGGLGDLPFGALPGKKPNVVLWEEVRLRWVACPQDLLPSRRAGARGAGALVVGGVPYEPDPPVAAPPDAVGADAALRRAAPWLDQPPPMGPYEPLPASRAQAEALAPLWGDGAALLSGPEATESGVLQAAPGRRVLHFATRGVAPEALWLGLARAPYIEDLAFARQSGHGHDPRTLAGVALAGAGAGRGGAGDDGVLSATQAALLDLGACEAVVLSAWPTAQGTPGTALARTAMAQGFLSAGARTVVANLWRVEEEAAGLLLARVHEAFARAEAPPAGGEVLREAALWLRGHKGDAGRTYELPRHWAAWIAYERR